VSEHELVESSDDVEPRFRIADIHPVPDDETLAVITAALQQAWPVPVAVAAPTAPVQDNWRFGQRRWRERAIPRQTWGRGPVA